MTLDELYKIYLKYPVITTDSRNIPPSSLFALRGEKFDGNTFAESAIQHGAAHAIIDDKKFLTDKCILFQDVLNTLQSLATYHRRKLALPIIAVTGTNGKTTTKELLKTVISTKFKVVATKGNLNNHIGVPLTLLDMNSKTEFGIVEMRANHVGEISQLCGIAEPDCGIITNIGKAHLEGFGSFENVIKAKSELYQYLDRKNGRIFYNIDNPILIKVVSELKTEKISYGTSEQAFCRCLKKSVNPFLSLQVKSKNDLIIETNLAGEYNFENVMASICAGTFFKVEINLIARALKEYEPKNSRSQLYASAKNKMLIDCYNANPSSMEAAIDNFSKLDSKGLPKILILGDMLELGSYSLTEHRRIIEIIEKKGFEKVYLVGKNFQDANKNNQFITFKDSDDLLNYITAKPIINTFILLKGSRGIKMEKVIEGL